MFSKHFEIQFNISDVKYRSIAICYKNDISIINHVKLDGISVIQFQKSSFDMESVNMAVVYRSPNTSKNEFIFNLAGVIEDYNINILLGDFNINSFCYTIQNSTLDRFQMIIKEPTHIDGGLLDHIYLENCFMRDKESTVLTRSIYFSDHDAFKCKIIKNDSINVIDFSVVETSQTG